MKKAVSTVILLALCTLSFVSCKKSYHCSCSFRNKVVYTEDLGIKYEKNAKEKCSSYDSTITGEIWKCTLY